MIILGLCGMPKSGKGVAIDVLKKYGYQHVSMSKLLKSKIVEDGHLFPEDKIPRSTMLTSAREFRLSEPGMLARLSMEEIEKMPPNIKGAIVDGIRNPGEISTLIDMCHKAGHELRLVGIEVSPDFDEDCRIRYARLMADPDQRIDIADLPKWPEFVENSRLEWDDKENDAGIHVKRCLEIIEGLAPIGRILKNGEDKSREEWQNEIDGYVSSLEGQSNHPEK